MNTNINIIIKIKEIEEEDLMVVIKDLNVFEVFNYDYYIKEKSILEDFIFPQFSFLKESWGYNLKLDERNIDIS